jgi:hypothetical protein
MDIGGHMEEKNKGKEQAEIVAPFTAEQIARIREIVDEQIAKREKQQLQDRRFGIPYPSMEHK